MAFELDPIFHTPTMVKILKAQGFFQLATKVCGKILELDPTRIEAKRLWEDLKKPHTSSELASSEISEEEDDITEPGIPVEALQSEAISSIEPNLEAQERKRKLEILEGLLEKVEARAT